MTDIDYKSLWSPTPKHSFNHGSFGATPIAIQQRHAKLIQRINADRESFIWHEVPDTLPKIRSAVANFINANMDDVVIVDNATEGVNTVLKSLDFSPGDELLITNHIYSPYNSLLKELSDRTGLRIVIAQIPLPIRKPSDITNAILAKASSKTRLAFIDHITSPTALVMPVKDIVAGLAKRGIETLVDGAHAPGQVRLDMQDIGAAYYTGNHHKWLCAPLQSGFLYVRNDKQDAMIPAIGSYGSDHDTEFAGRFAWQGTRDYAARFCVPDTIDYIARLHTDGWDGVMRRNHALALTARELLCDAVGATPPCPPDMIGSMFTLSLGRLNLPDDILSLPEAMQMRTFMMRFFGYGLYAHRFQDEYFIRISCPLYVNMNDIQVLAKNLAQILPSLKA